MASEDRFQYEWTKFKKMTPAYEQQFLKWVTPLLPSDFKNKIILDAGCGMGRNSYWMLKYGAKKVVAFDFDKATISVARENLKKFSQAIVRFGSIYEITEKNAFDIVLSIGVIHHLEKPQLAIDQMVKACKKNGRVLIWVYGKEGNELLLKLLLPLRLATPHLPLSFLFHFSYILSWILLFAVKIPPINHPYFKQLRDFRRWHIHSIIFDQLIPKYARYYTKNEAFKLLSANSKLKEVRIFRVNDNSWSVSAVKR